MRRNSRRRICFVTGTRAEFGLMSSVLRAIRASKNLQLQIVATGMHLDRSRGRTALEIQQQGWKIDRIVPWKRSITETSIAQSTGLAIAGLAQAYESLRSDIILVVGDRVEAFAAASAAHISGRVVAHVHGGDRALGQVDDSLRHAITKLAHVHFPATKQSERRIARLGEDRWRIHRVGSPGIDGILKVAAPDATLPPRTFALLVLHPVEADVRREHRRAEMLMRAILASDILKVVVIYPNNDPGSEGIIRAWRRWREHPRVIAYPNVDRPRFLALMRDAAMLVGNSSSGIIEAASFGTPVIDIGPRQLGRERNANVANVPYDSDAIRRAAAKIWNHGRPRRSRAKNVYAARSSGAGARIAKILSTLEIDSRLLRKLISY
jgi:UDP-hydrolysing UDP-N-acetyl-D-glucosamine 2-epimerase